MNKLESFESLTQKIQIYMPTTINNIKNSIINNEKEKTLELLLDLYQGSTEYKVEGAYKSRINKKVNKEEIVICESYCSSKQLKQTKDLLINHCSTLARVLKQESIALTINNNMYFIT